MPDLFQSVRPVVGHGDRHLRGNGDAWIGYKPVASVRAAGAGQLVPMAALYDD